jgi:hypothetical protein
VNYAVLRESSNFNSSPLSFTTYDLSNLLEKKEKEKEKEEKEKKQKKEKESLILISRCSFFIRVPRVVIGFPIAIFTRNSFSFNERKKRKKHSHWDYREEWF